MRRDEIDALAERLNALLAGLEAEGPPEVVAALAEIVDGIQRVHAEGLRRVAEVLGENGDLFARALDDPVISNLFLLYDLAVVDERGRAEAALASVRPLARAHGGEIELVDVEDGVVSVRLHGACHGCPSSTATLRGGLERVLAEKLPGFVGLEVIEANGGRPYRSGGDRRALEDGLPATSAPASAPARRLGGAATGSVTGDISAVPEENLVRLERRLSERADRGDDSPPRPRRVDAASVSELPRGALHGSLIHDIALLLVALDGEVVAYRNACPGSILPLHLGTLEGGEIVCPWHGCRFDVRSGARRGTSGEALERLPVAIEAGRVRVELR